MKILYVITGLGMGGAEIITVGIANQMANWGHDVTLLYLTGENAQMERIDTRIRVVSLDISKKMGSVIRGLCKTIHIIKAWKPDIIHSHMVHANILCRVLRIFCRIPFLICTEHSKNIEGAMRMFLYRVTDFLSDLNTNVSEEATAYFVHKKAFGRLNSITVYNGVNLSYFTNDRNIGKTIRARYSIKDSDFLFINIGRLTQAKDQANLITAFARLREQYFNVKLMIVGEGTLRGDLEQQILEFHIKDSVLLVGEQWNVVGYYSAADCFVLSSAWEGFGLVLVEAMACKLPVITTNAGGCAEVVANPDYLVPPKDANALYCIMKRMFEMPKEQRLALGVVNRESAFRFDSQKIYRQWLDIYNKQCHSLSNLKNKTC